MRRFPTAVMFAIFAGIAGIFALPALIARNSSSVASLAIGTDDAFSTEGLEPRENQIGGGALRWLRPQATFRFDDLGPGPIDIELEVRDHRTEVILLANGAQVGVLARGERRFASRIQLSGPDLVFGLETEGFDTSTRKLGTQFVSLTVRPVASPGSGLGAVSRRVWLAAGVVGIAAAVTAFVSGLNPLSVLPPIALFGLMVLPAGLWRSSWLFQCAALLAGASAVAAFVARRAQGSVASRSLLQVALLVAITVHGLLPPSPLLNQGDAQLHGNKLGEVAGGNLFPTSRTDHKPPFPFPYGFSFYALLSPWSDSGVSNVAVVRHGAAFASCLSVLGLSLFLGRMSSSLAAASILLWTFSPVNVKTMAFGNLSNVFAQAIFVLFLAAAGLLPQGRVRAVVLSLLVIVSATAHLSAFIVLFVLLAATFLFPTDRHGPAFKPLLAGVLVAAAYYLSFLPMMLRQLPRLLAERGGSSGVFDPWRLPAQVLDGLGWPLIALLALAALVASLELRLPLSRSLIVTAVILAVAALVSPIEVRYLLALSPVLVGFAAAAIAGETPRSFPRQNLSALVDLPGLRRLGSEVVRLPLSILLLAAAVVEGARVLLDFIPLAQP